MLRNGRIGGLDKLFRRRGLWGAFGHLVLALAVLRITGGPVLATPPATPPATQWKTGIALQRTLIQRVEDIQSQAPFREFLQRLGRIQRIAIMLDRRTDPSQRIDVNHQDQVLARVFDSLARQAGAAVTTIGPVLYIGPEPTVRKLAAVARSRRREAGRLPASRSRVLLGKRPWRWNELAEPRVLVGELAGQVGVTVKGLERVPHDLWPAADLPPLAWTDRMTLVLAGFDLTFALVDGGHAVQLVPMPDRIDRIATIFDTALQTGERNTKRSSRPIRSHGIVYTMKVRNSAGVVLETIQQRTGLRFEIDPRVGDRLQQFVRFEVQDVRLDRLLRETLTPVGLTYQRHGDVIKVIVR